MAMAIAAFPDDAEVALGAVLVYVLVSSAIAIPYARRRRLTERQLGCTAIRPWLLCARLSDPCACRLASRAVRPGRCYCEQRSARGLRWSAD